MHAGTVRVCMCARSMSKQKRPTIVHKKHVGSVSAQQWCGKHEYLVKGSQYKAAASRPIPSIYGRLSVSPYKPWQGTQQFYIKD